MWRAILMLVLKIFLMVFLVIVFVIRVFAIKKCVCLFLLGCYFSVSSYRDSVFMEVLRSFCQKCWIWGCDLMVLTWKGTRKWWDEMLWTKLRFWFSQKCLNTTTTGAGAAVSAPSICNLEITVIFESFLRSYLRTFQQQISSTRCSNTSTLV